MANIIYALCNPTTDTVHYIGLSSVGLERPRQHLRRSARGEDSAKGAWLRSMFELGVKPLVRVLEVVARPSDLPERERSWIAKGTHLGWPLTNASKGGEFGGSGGRGQRMQLLAQLRAPKSSASERISDTDPGRRRAQVRSRLQRAILSGGFLKYATCAYGVTVTHVVQHG